MANIITTRWGNGYVRDVEFFQEGGTVPLDLENRRVFYTVKDNTTPDNDDKAKVKVELVKDELVSNKAQLILDKDDLKFPPESYSADFKVFLNGNPTNTERIQHIHLDSVTKDDLDD